MKKKEKRVVAIDMGAEHKKFCDNSSRTRLRDDIAIAAMAAIIGKFPAIEVDHESAVAEAMTTAHGAYAYADAMLSAREAKP